MILHIAGLGPGEPALLTRDVHQLLASGLPLLLRTRHHPVVSELGLTGGSCDDLYAGAANFEAAYDAIAARVLDAASAGDLVYAVPGHPLVAEGTVGRVITLAADRGVAVELHPGLSFADVAAVALGVDFGRVQLADAMDLRLDPQRPVLVSQVYDRDRLSALKLDLLEMYPAAHEVAVLSRLGTASQEVRRLPLAELDHAPAGYLECVYVPALVPLDDLRRFDGLAYVIARLHAPDGCPWDREQTHASLRPHLLEEAYETLEAIDAGDPAKLAEELGDVLLQVLMHAAVGEREGTFAFADVAEAIARKLIRRHPHVFGGTSAASAEEVYRNWEALKQAEKPRQSILEGVPPSLPALAASQSIQGRARRVGFDWPDIEGPLAKLAEELAEFARADSGDGDREDEFGDILFVIANVAQRLGIDAEQALRRANAKFRARFGLLERLAGERGLDLKELDLAGLDALWDEAKLAVAAESELRTP